MVVLRLLREIIREHEPEPASARAQTPLPSPHPLLSCLDPRATGDNVGPFVIETDK